jgi:hypothetical protein
VEALVITQQHRAEEMSRAYTRAVSAHAGLLVSRADLDYGDDGTFSVVEHSRNGYVPSGYKIDFQLKASGRWELRDNDVIYDLDVKNYNDIVNRNKGRATVRCLLILLCLPKEEKEWLNISEDELLIRKCCYWTLLDGEETDNTDQIRIHIPRANIFNPEAIQALFEKLQKGEDLL